MQKNKDKIKVELLSKNGTYKPEPQKNKRKKIKI